MFYTKGTIKYYTTSRNAIVIGFGIGFVFRWIVDTVKKVLNKTVLQQKRRSQHHPLLWELSSWILISKSVQIDKLYYRIKLATELGLQKRLDRARLI